MSQLLHYDLANVPVNIFYSGKCSPPPPHPVLPHLTKPHPTPTHPTVTLVSKEQPNKLFFSMTYILSSGKFLSLYFDSWKISQMANFPPGQYFYGRTLNSDICIKRLSKLITTKKQSADSVTTVSFGKKLYDPVLVIVTKHTY